MTIAALTAAQIAGVVQACQRGIDAGVWVDVRRRVQNELKAVPPIYSYGVRDVIDAMKLMFFQDGSPDKGNTSVEAYLWIIDQRQRPENPDATLIPGDPRWVYVGAAPDPTPSPSPVVVTDSEGPHTVVNRFSSREGFALRIQTDTDNSSAQREGTTFPQFGEFSGSEDGGYGFSQNVIFPGGGQPGYIPDPTRTGVSIRMDRMGALSFNVFTAGAEFEPGKFKLVVAHKGQLAVFYPQNNGDFILRLPQFNGRLLVEKGWGGEPSHPSGHMEVRSTHEVQLGPDIGYQR